MAVCWLNQILKVLSNPEEHVKPLGYMAIKCLTHVISMKKLDSAVPQASKDLLRCLIPLIRTSEYEGIFDIALSFFT